MDGLSVRSFRTLKFKVVERRDMSSFTNFVGTFVWYMYLRSFLLGSEGSYLTLRRSGSLEM